jgi:hypothetical protein
VRRLNKQAFLSKSFTAYPSSICVTNAKDKKISPFNPIVSTSLIFALIQSSKGIFFNKSIK